MILMAGLLLALPFSCAHPPLMINNVKATEGGCLSFVTSIPAVCRVTFCAGGKCFFTEPSPRDTLHTIDLPGGADKVRITAEADGEIVTLEVR